MDGLEDVKPLSAASAENSGGTAGRSPAATEQSSDAQSGSDSSPTHGVKAEPKSIAEALSGVKPEADQAGEGSPTHEAEASGGESAADGAAGGKDGKPEAKAADESSLNVPFAKRPEWQALKTAAGEKFGDVVKAVRPVFEQAQRLQDRLTAERPRLEAVAELEAHTGDAAGFTRMREIVKTYATEPEAAVPILESMLKDARERAGLVVVSDDLRGRLGKVDALLASGQIDEVQAREWKADIQSAERSRAGERQARQRAEQERQAQTPAQVNAAGQQRATALNQWEESIRSKDPSFGEVTESDHPTHGESVADQVLDAVELLFTRNPGATPAQVVAEADRVWKLAQKRLARPGRSGSAVMTSQDSRSGVRRAVPKTLREALDSVEPERAN